MTTDAPLITTVIPTYRRPALLKRAIASALAQTEPRLVVCVYDNASGDETAAVVAAMAARDPRVQYHCHPTNLGMSGNIAAGLSAVTTPYWSLLSDDDALLPEFYVTALRGFADHPDAMLSATGTISRTESGQLTHVTLTDWPRLGYFAPPDGLYAWTIERHPYITGCLYRRDVLDLVGLPDPQVFHSDFDYEWRVVARYPYVVNATPGAVISVHANQASRVSGADEWVRSYRVMRERVAAVETLTPAERARAAAVLRATFASALTVFGVSGLRAGHSAVGQAAARHLRADLGARGRGLLLALASAVCARSRLAQRSLAGAYTLLLRWHTRHAPSVAQ